MRVITAVCCLLLSAGSAFAADDATACRSRHGELAAKAMQFKGEAMTQRIIKADLDRAMKELLEGDADECSEALDHAAKLLANEG